MLKTTFVFLAILAIVPLSSFTKKASSPPVKTIIIDPGHGGSDQGAPGLVTTEAKICLELSLKLGAQIEKEIPGVRILYTRTTDIIPGNKSNKNDGLRYRADYANQSSADLFISIHCNSAGKRAGGWNERRISHYENRVTYQGKGSKKKKVIKKVPVYETVYVHNHVRGTETYIWTAAENSHKEQMVIGEFAHDDSVGVEIPEDDPAINALKLIYTKKYFVNSLRLAELVQKEFATSGRPNRGVKQRNDKGIWVLHATGMPSILVEAGFISNKEEEEYMMSEEGQAEIVNNLTSALKQYITQPAAKPVSAVSNGLPE